MVSFDHPGRSINRTPHRHSSFDSLHGYVDPRKEGGELGRDEEALKCSVKTPCEGITSGFGYRAIGLYIL